MSVDGKSVVSVKFEISERVEGWILGSFYFVADGVTIGDSSDCSVDLRGCLHWLEVFLREAKNRFEPGLFDMPKEKAFLLLGASVLAAEDQSNLAQEAYENIYGRFHISHLGMSSFDSVILLLVQNSSGDSRLIWKDGDNLLHEAILPAGEFERLIKETVGDMKHAFESIG